MKYKVLSVRQPYASLLVGGIKDVENRSRRTNFRGTVLIHASAKMHDIVGELLGVEWLSGLTNVERAILSVARNTMSEEHMIVRKMLLNKRRLAD